MTRQVPLLANSRRIGNAIRDAVQARGNETQFGRWRLQRIEITGERVQLRVAGAARGTFRPFDVHPNGKRFTLGPAAPTLSGARQDHITVIFNVFDELRRIAPNR